MRLSFLIVLLSLVAVSAFAQQPDSTVAPVKQAADTAVVVAPPQTTPPVGAAAVVAPPQTAPAPATTSPSSDPDGSRRVKIGAGAHYMKTVGDIKDAEGFDSNALNLVLALKMGLGLIALEGDSEWVLDYGGSSKTLWLPQVFALVGGLIYGGAGIGIGYLDGEWFDRPVYSLRAGVNLPLGPVAVDVNASYQFMNSSAFEDVDSEDLDSVTFGALIWF